MTTTSSKSLWAPKEFIVILDPAGDAKKTGRCIGDSFERGLTLQCAEKIKTCLEQRHSHVKVMITRLPGDIVYDLQNASLANRVNADLFINLNFYHSTETKPTVFLYQFSYGNDFATHQPGLVFHTYDQAYKINKNSSDMLMQLCTAQLTQPQYNNLFTVSTLHALPIKPLIGVIAPSIAVEIGLKNKDAWATFVEPLAATISAAIEELM